MEINPNAHNFYLLVPLEVIRTRNLDNYQSILSIIRMRYRTTSGGLMSREATDEFLIRKFEAEFRITGTENCGLGQIILKERRTPFNAFILSVMPLRAAVELASSIELTQYHNTLDLTRDRAGNFTPAFLSEVGSGFAILQN